MGHPARKKLHKLKISFLKSHQRTEVTGQATTKTRDRKMQKIQISSAKTEAAGVINQDLNEVLEAEYALAGELKTPGAPTL